MRRVLALIKRAVTHGTGLEELREYQRLAACVGDEDLHIWLENMSKGAFITLDDLRSDHFAWREKFDEESWKRLAEFGFSLRLKHAFAVDAPHTILKRRDIPEENRIKKNAWHILRHTKRTDGRL